MGRVVLAMPAKLLPLHPFGMLALVLVGEVVPVLAVSALENDVFARHVRLNPSFYSWLDHRTASGNHGERPTA
jgi:hypothetical protein